jgi:hypothetical protein
VAREAACGAVRERCDSRFCGLDRSGTNRRKQHEQQGGENEQPVRGDDCHRLSPGSRR